MYFIFPIAIGGLSINPMNYCHYGIIKNHTYSLALTNTTKGIKHYLINFECGSEEQGVGWIIGRNGTFWHRFVIENSNT